MRVLNKQTEKSISELIVIQYFDSIILLSIYLAVSIVLYILQAWSFSPLLACSYFILDETKI